MYITGKLLGRNKQPIPGTVTVANYAGNMKFSDTVQGDGSYAVNVDVGDWIVFSSPGYREGGVTVKQSDSVISVELYPETIVSPLVLMAIAAVILVMWEKRKKKGIGAFEKKDLITVFIAIGGIIGFSLIKKLLETLGIWKGQDTKTLDNASINPNSFWNPTYWQNFSSYSYAISTATAQAYADKIYNAFGAFNDDEEAVIGVFTSLRTKANASFLAYVFQQRYGMNLLAFLRGGWWPQDRLSDADVAQINDYVNRLPSN